MFNSNKGIQSLLLQTNISNKKKIGLPAAAQQRGRKWKIQHTFVFNVVKLLPFTPDPNIPVLGSFLSGHVHLIFPPFSQLSNTSVIQLREDTVRHHSLLVRHPDIPTKPHPSLHSLIP